MSTEEKDTRKALSGYRTRNDVEVSFDDVKNSLDMRRMRNHTEQTVRGKIFVVFIALILLSQLRLTVRNIPPKQRRYWTEHEFLDKVASYTKVHFEGKYKDVYTVPTANQRHVFDMLELPYRYKGVAYNMPPKKESQKVDADHSTTHDNERTDEVPAT
jgi:transposase